MLEKVVYHFVGGNLCLWNDVFCLHECSNGLDKCRKMIITFACQKVYDPNFKIAANLFYEPCVMQSLCNSMCQSMLVFTIGVVLSEGGFVDSPGGFYFFF